MKRDKREIKKSLGQHYLIDKHLLKKISDLVYQNDPKIIIEIGAGTGLLTKELLLKGGRVHAIEIEKKSLDELKKILSSDKSLTDHVNLGKKLSLQHGDALRISHDQVIENLLKDSFPQNLPKDPQQNSLPDFPHPPKNPPQNSQQDSPPIFQPIFQSMAICGNLPYNIAAKLIVKLLEEIDDFFERVGENSSLKERNIQLVFLIQKEVAKRMLTEKIPTENSKKSKEKKSLISYLISWYGKAKIHFDIKPNSFFPAPKVMSSVIEISINSKPISDKKNYFFYKKCIKAAFQNRRKTLSKSLSFSLPEYSNTLDYFFSKNPLLKKKRADDLTADDYLKLALHVKENRQK